MYSDHSTSPPPGRLIAWLGIAVGLTAILLGVHALKPFGTPSHAVSKALEALTTGDAARLRADERLGFQRRAESEIKRRGEAEYARILGIFDKEAQLGD